MSLPWVLGVSWIGGLNLTSSHAPARVLVADDSHTIRKSAELFLQQGGHEVLLAEDGLDLLAKVLDFRPHIVFCDIQMPFLDGFQACALLKRHPECAHIPVLMLTGRDGAFDRARGQLAGCQDYLTKPFRKNQMLDAVRQWVVPLSPKASGLSLPGAPST